MARNPYRRRNDWCGHATSIAVQWVWHFSDQHALRIRWGARAACRRLRAERDEARANYRFMVERACDEKLDGYRELGAQAAAAENELDTARRELRALEWLVRQGHVVARDKAFNVPNWHGIALARGMKETDDD